MAKKPLNTPEPPVPTGDMPVRGGLYERRPDGSLALLEATDAPADPPAPTAPAEGEG